MVSEHIGVPTANMNGDSCTQTVGKNTIDGGKLFCLKHRKGFVVAQRYLFRMEWTKNHVLLFGGVYYVTGLDIAEQKYV
jgi:hypothetical protein